MTSDHGSANGTTWWDRFLLAFRNLSGHFGVGAAGRTTEKAQSAGYPAGPTLGQSLEGAEWLDEADPRHPSARIRRKLDAFAVSLAAGSPEAQAWTALRHEVDAELSEIADGTKRLHTELREETHQYRNVLQTGMMALAAASPISGSAKDLEQRMAAWFKAQVPTRIGKTYEDDGLALMEPMLEYLINPKKYGITADRRRLEGGPLVVPPATIRLVTMLIRELATNARKHGAFRENGGSVDVAWRVEGTGRLAKIVLEWREQCSFEVGLPSASGAGYKGITREWPKLFRFEVMEKHLKTGVWFVFRIPQETVDLPDKPRVLIVDDDHEYLYFENDVSIDYAKSVEAAISALSGGPRPDFVLLDRTLGPDDGIRVAEWMAIRGVPFAFFSGREEGWGNYAKALRVGKPFNPEELPGLLQTILTSPYARCLK